MSHGCNLGYLKLYIRGNGIQGIRRTFPVNTPNPLPQNPYDSFHLSVRMVNFRDPAVIATYFCAYDSQLRPRAREI